MNESKKRHEGVIFASINPLFYAAIRELFIQKGVKTVALVSHSLVGIHVPQKYE